MPANSACVGNAPEPVEGSRTTETGAVPGAAIASFLGGADDESRYECLNYSNEIEGRVLGRTSRAWTFVMRSSRRLAQSKPITRIRSAQEDSLAASLIPK